MFDLNVAVSTWRQSMQHDRSFLTEDLDELERHVRDHVAALIRTGIPEQQAFQRAIRDIGSRGTMEAEYRKVFWGKVRRQHRVVEEIQWRLAVLASYVKVAYRNAVRHRGYAALNIFGLALGMGCGFLILLFVQDELSFDRFHKNAGSIYRVNWDFEWNGREGVGPGTPPPLAAAFTQELPGVAAATRIYAAPRTVVRNQEAFFSERGILAVDTNFFDVFDFSMQAGDPRTALAKPNSLVLTETAARKYFGDRPAIGQSLVLGTAYETYGGFQYDPLFKVMGVVADPPHNSHLQFDILTSMASYPEVTQFEWSWVWMQLTTYVELESGVDAGAVEAMIPDLVRRRAADAFRRLDIDYDAILSSGGRWGFLLQPFTDVYLGSVEIGNRLGPVGNRSYVTTAATIALFVLVIACINFMNLSTARSSTRSREVGIRKVVGSDRRRLVGQFLIEAMVFSALAAPLALIVVAAGIGPFNSLSGKTLHLNLFHSAWLPAAVILLPAAVGLVAGSYPGLYLSSFRPVQVLKGTHLPGNRARLLRHALVVFQFAVTIALIVCALLVRRQLDFMRETDLGFHRDRIILLDNENDRLRGHEDFFKEQLKRHPEIAQASISTNIPPYYGFQDSYNVEGRDQSIGLISYLTDEDLIPTLEIELIEGRNFSKAFPSDSAGVILNETAVRAFGLANPIGAIIEYPGGAGRFHVIGVMRDFYFLTLREPVTPFALFHRASKSYGIADSYVVVRPAGDDVRTVIDLLESEWKVVTPDMPFEYSFLDENVEAEYQNEKRLGRIFGVFSAMAVIIACLGMVGLAAFSAEQRTKEIGIRKVLGARVTSLVALLSTDYVKLVGIAFLIAAPLAYVFMRQWLDDFSYRIQIGPDLFLLTGLLALLLALLTVSWQSIRAALSDPATTLRYE